MNQHQVNIRSPECFNSPVERLAYLSATYGIGRDFRNNEHFTPADTAFLDSVPHFDLVVVALRRIDQTVSQSDGVFHTLCGSLLESRRADTQLRHLYPVVQHDTENGRQCIGRLSRLSVVGSSAPQPVSMVPVRKHFCRICRPASFGQRDRLRYRHAHLAYAQPIFSLCTL